MVITDVTAREERERSAQEQHDFAAVVERFYRDRACVLEFFEEAQGLVAVAADDSMPAEEVARAVHTLKGTSGAMGLWRLAHQCEALEDRMAENAGLLGDDGRRHLLGAWVGVRRRFSVLLDAGASRRREVDEGELEALVAAIEAGAPPAELARLARLCRYDPVDRRLAALADQAERLAVRLCKTPLAVSIDGGDLRLPPRCLGEFWNACVHVVRNAVDHGLESREERQTAGKPEEGRLALTARLQGDLFEVEIRDCGRGIDWEIIRDRARAAGRPCATPEDLTEALFATGISTKAEVSDISGRGVGMGAARAACERTGGTMTIASECGRGTTVLFRWPAARVAAISATPSPLAA
jgi:two-component system chemotaxis sensor kinase CheA